MVKPRFVAFRGTSPAGHPALVHGHPPIILSDGVMIIDCHGHYTTEPKDLLRCRKDQIDNLERCFQAALQGFAEGHRRRDPREPRRRQLKLQRERGTDLTIFSPRACGMGHHVGDYDVSLALGAASATT